MTDTTIPNALLSRPRGVHPVKQQRSLQTQQALLAAGRDLLQTHDLPALSVAQVAAAAGVSVGSFYARFEDKNAWFAELARQAALVAVADLQTLLDSAAMRQAPAARKVALLMRWLVRLHQEHRGIFRASVSDPARTDLYWVPLARLCTQVSDLVYTLLAPDLQGVPPKVRRQRVQFAFQVVFATLVNAVLHGGGPVGLHDPALARDLARTFLASVGFTAPAA